MLSLALERYDWQSSSFVEQLRRNAMTIVLVPTYARPQVCCTMWYSIPLGNIIMSVSAVRLVFLYFNVRSVLRLRLMWECMPGLYIVCMFLLVCVPSIFFIINIA